MNQSLLVYDARKLQYFSRKMKRHKFRTSFKDLQKNLIQAEAQTSLLNLLLFILQSRFLPVFKSKDRNIKNINYLL